MWDLPGPGLEPVCPASAARFSTTAPPGKSPRYLLFKEWLCCTKAPEGPLVSPHRSQPVLKVEATMEFTPREVARDVYECRERVVKDQIAGEVRVCLRVRKNTRDRLGEGEAG